jgi:hypothetical protein
MTMMVPATAPIANPARTIPRRHLAPRVQQVRVRGREPDALRRRLDRGPVLMIEQPWRTSRRVRIRLATLLPVLLFLFSLYQNLGNMDTVDFHRDEARWINRAHFLEALRDPFGQTWADYYSTRGQPPLGNYLMGIGLLIQGRDLQTNRVWDFNYDEEWNIRAGAMPETGDLNAGRRTNAVIGALVVLCVYAMATKLTNRVGGLAGGLFLSVHPLHLRLSSQALSDELLALVIALSFLAAYRFATRPSIGWGLALGALLGLGGAAKLSPLLLSLPLAAFGAVCLAWSLFREGRSGIRWNRARFGWMLLFQPAIAFFVFVAANPFLWSNPLRLTWELFDFRRTEMNGQSTAWPIAHVDGPMSALMRIGRRLNTDYSSSIRIEKYIEQTASVTMRHVSIDVILMAAGLIALLALVIRRGLWSAPSLTAYLMASQAATVVVGMGVDFYRYFLPVLIVGSICLGVGVGAAWLAIR